MSQLTFDPKTGLTAPETARIRGAVQDDWQNAFKGSGAELNVEPSTPAGQLVDAETAEIEAKNAELLFLANMFDPKTAEGRWQDALGNIYFLTRKIAEPTVVTCRVTGLRGTRIPYGAIVRNTEGYALICNASADIGDDGTAETTFRVSEPGPVEIAAGSVTQIVTVIAGWDTVNNETAGATGRDVETRSEFEARRYASVANNAHGSAAALYGTVANIPGVLDCRVLENTGPDPVTLYGVEVGGHSIAVCVYGAEDGDIAEAIYRKKDAGCGTSGNAVISYVAEEYGGALYEYKLYRPEPVAFNVRISIANAARLSDATRKAIAEAVVSDFLGKSLASGNARVGLASTIYASRFYISVMSVDGVNQLNDIQIALGSGAFGDSVTINADQEPVMTTENVTIVEA